MKIANIHETDVWFQVLQTTVLSQTAVMTLAPGKSSSDEPNSHARSDQVLLVVEGELCAEIGGERCPMKSGDVCLIPAGTLHRFENTGKKKAITFNVYAPPEYQSSEEG